MFADSSAVVKLYADETGEDVVRAVSDILSISLLARVEVASALWRKHRIGELASEQVGVLVADFEADFHGDDDDTARFVVVGLDEDTAVTAARLAATHGLRSLDAVQLSSAIQARIAMPECNSFMAFDAELRSSAAAEGFGLVPATT